MLKITEVIGSLMKQELGNKLSAGRIKSTLQPVILQELVDVSDLSFSSDNGKKRHYSHRLFRTYHALQSSVPAMRTCLLMSLAASRKGESFWEAFGVSG